MVLQFYFFLNHVLRKIERTAGEHYEEEPLANPYIYILDRID
jgi:hypothetical protein